MTRRTWIAFYVAFLAIFPIVIGAGFHFWPEAAFGAVVFVGAIVYAFAAVTP